MIKAIQALLTGLLIVFVMDFLFFLGLQLHYLDSQGIKVYYNTLFADNQNPFVFFPLVFLTAWISNYWSYRKSALSLLGMLFLIALSPLLPSVGLYTGDALFRQKNITISVPPHVYKGDVIYTDRNQLYFYDTDLKRIITLPRSLHQ